MLVDCQTCGAVVDGIEVVNYTTAGGSDEAPFPDKYTLLKCPLCEGPMLVVQEDYGLGWDDPLRLFPPKGSGISTAVPKPIRIAYEEARDCFRARAYTASAIMCRKALQGIADEHKIKARNLDTALKQMKDKGIIERRLFEWADALRVSGNEAAHDVTTTISHQDAQDILDFTNALLEYVFTFQDKFEKFRTRRHTGNSENCATLDGPETV